MFILRDAGINAIRKLSGYTSSPFSAEAWGYFVPRWTIEACHTFWKAQYGKEEIVRLLQRGPEDEEFIQQLTFATLKAS